MRVSSSGGCTSVISPPLKPGPEPVFEGGQLAWRAVGGDDDLLIGVVQRVEGVEELTFLDALFAFDELDVIDEQHVDIAIAALEGDPAVVAQASELMKSLVNSSVETYLTRIPGNSRCA